MLVLARDILAHKIDGQGRAEQSKAGAKVIGSSELSYEQAIMA